MADFCEMEFCIFLKAERENLRQDEGDEIKNCGGSDQIKKYPGK